MAEYLIRGTDYLAKRPNFKLLGRSAELQRLITILIRSHSNSVLMYGPAGVGISSLSLGVQALKKKENVSFDVLNKRMFWLDTNELFMSGNSKEINDNFNLMMDTLNRTPDSVLIIPETRDFIDAARNNGSMHFLNAFMSSIRNGTNQFIFESRNENLGVVLGCNSEIAEVATMFPVNPPINGDLDIIVEDAARNLSKAHGINVSTDAWKEAIKLTQKNPVKDGLLPKAQPSKSIALLDRSLAAYRLDAHTVTPDQETLLKQYHDAERNAEEQVIEAEVELNKLLQSEEPAETDSVIADFDKLVSKTASFETPQVKLLRKIIAEQRRIQEENKLAYRELTSKINENLLLTGQLVQVEFSLISGIPVGKLNEDTRTKLLQLEKNLNTVIYDQEESIHHIANTIKVASLGRKSDAPTSYLLLGPSGVGKTETPRRIAAELGLSMVKFDMGEYMEKHAVSRLIGAPPGYDGFDQGGQLTNAMLENPHRLIMFDEIEKAHPDVFNVLLAVLDDGRLTDGMGRTVFFKDSYVFMTSNVGQPRFLRIGPDYTFEMARQDALDDLTKPREQDLNNPGGALRGEFLNRINGRENILCFNRLTLGGMEKITKREFDNLNNFYAENNVTVVVSHETLAAFCKDRYNPARGARGLPGIVKSQVEPIIVNTLLENPTYSGSLQVEYDIESHKFNSKFNTTLKQAA